MNILNKTYIDLLEENCVRFEWALPLLTGSIDNKAEQRALALAMALGKGLEGKEAVDVAIAATAPELLTVIKDRIVVERQDFEAALKRQCWPMSEPDLTVAESGAYASAWTQSNWEIWQDRALLAAPAAVQPEAKAAPAPWSVVAESQTVTLNYSFASAVLGALFNGGTHNPEAFEQIKQSFAAVMRCENTALPWFLSAPAGAWHDAVLAECMKIEGAYDSADPAKTVAALLTWHIQQVQEVSDTIKAQADNYVKLTCGSDPSAVGEKDSSQDTKDAARYRWLRSDDIEVQAGQREIVVYRERLPFREDQRDEVLTESELDEAIDAAMASSPSPAEGA